MAEHKGLFCIKIDIFFVLCAAVCLVPFFDKSCLQTDNPSSKIQDFAICRTLMLSALRLGSSEAIPPESRGATASAEGKP